MKKFVADFKKFITRGNVLDLAVAVIIGAAFSRIITSLVRDILMPVISLIVGKDGFDNYKYVITPANPLTGTAENAILYGVFIQNIIDFLIIAFVVFLIVRLFTRMTEFAYAKKLEEEARLKAIESEKKANEPKKPTVEELLTDIKVLLEKNKQ